MLPPFPHRALVTWLSVLAAAVLPLLGAAAEREVAPVPPAAPPRVLRVGVEKHYAPFLFLGREGAPAGIAVDYLRLLEAQPGLGVRFDFSTAGDLATLLDAARRGEVDVLPALTETEARAAFLRFTPPFFSVPAVLVVRRDGAGPATLEKLAGRRVAVGQGYGVEEYLRVHHPDLLLVPAANDEACLRLLASGSVDGAVADLASASWILTSSGVQGLEVQGDVGFTYDLAMASPVGDLDTALLLQRGLAAVTRTEAARIRSRWILVERRDDGVNRVLLLAALGVAVAALLAWAGVRGVNRALRAKVADRTRDLAESERRLATTLAGVEEQRQELAAILRTALDGFWILDRDMRLTSVNDAICEMLGHAREDMVGRPLSDFEASETPEEIRAHRVRIDDAGADRFETRLRRKDGSLLEVEISAQSLRSGAKVVAFVRDVSARRRAEEQLRQAQKMEAVGRLAGGVAHDFNNLLTVILSGADLALHEAPAKGPLREEVEEIRGAAEKARMLTQQLLTFSRQQVLEPRVIDLNDVVRDTGRILGRLLTENVHLRTELDPALHAVHADPVQMQQVVMNLAINAQDAMPRGGTLTIRTANRPRPEGCGAAACPGDSGTCVLLSVSDTGTGMDEKTRARIFEPFFTTKPVGKGTGLGLSTVFGIVQQSGGHVRVESAPGHGSRFEICFPRTTQAVPDAAPRVTPVPPGTAARGETVIVIEDDERVRRVTVRMLARAGFDVVDAGSLEEAVERLAAHPRHPEVLLTDVRMPVRTGPEVAAALAERYPGLPVVFMSGYSSEEIGGPAERPRGAPFVQKPFTPETLVTRIREALDAASPVAG